MLDTISSVFIYFRPLYVVCQAFYLCFFIILYLGDIIRFLSSKDTMGVLSYNNYYVFLYCVNVNALPLGGVPEAEVVLPYILLVVLLIPFPLVCGMITDQVVALQPAE